MGVIQRVLTETHDPPHVASDLLVRMQAGADNVFISSFPGFSSLDDY